jgi:hypothetical protein
VSGESGRGWVAVQAVSRRREQPHGSLGLPLRAGHGCHNYVGTEHLLLGLLAEAEGAAARYLRARGVQLDDVREIVEGRIGRGDSICRWSSCATIGRRATQITDASPYSEIVGYLRTHRDKVDRVFETLSYFDGMNFAAAHDARRYSRSR